MKNIFQLILCVMLLNISACSIFQSSPKKLLSSCSDTQSRVAQQQWQLSYDQQHYFLQVIVERHADHWQWIMLNNLGQRLVTAAIKDGKVNIEQHQSHPANALISELLEAVQLSYWPQKDLEQWSNFQLSMTTNSKQRDVFLSGILYASIQYKNDNLWQGSLTYDHKKRNFQLIIESQLLN